MPRHRLKLAEPIENPSALPTSPDEDRPTRQHDSGTRAVSDKSYEGELRRTLKDLGEPFPDKLLVASNDFWKRCYAANIDAKVCAAVMYPVERHKHNVSTTTINENPSPDPANADTVRKLYRTEYLRAKTDLQREEARNRLMFYAGHQEGTQFVPATWDEVRAIVGLDPEASEGDPSAMEAAPVVHESAPVASEQAPVVHEGHIPWRKVERDPKAHEADMKLAEQYGVISSTEKVYELVGPQFAKEDQEVFIVIPLNLRGELKAAPYEIARGQRSRVGVGVDDVMRAVLDSGCEGFIVVHNHPTGQCRPSGADRQLTNQIKRAASVYGSSVKFLDHVVIGTKQCFSICENKVYKFS